MGLLKSPKAVLFYIKPTADRLSPQNKQLIPDSRILSKIIMQCYNTSLRKRVFLQFLCTAVLLLSTPLIAFEQLEQVVYQTLEWNPTVQAARQEAEQALARYEQVFGFFDPQFYASVGKAERSRTFVNLSGIAFRASDTTGAEAGIVKPLLPGVYLTAGATEQYLSDPPNGDGGLYQTLLGVSVQIPLLRNRGFKVWNLEQMQAYAEYSRASNRLLTVKQTIRHDVEQRFIAVYETFAALEVAKDATERYTALRREAEELVDLQVVPEYQTAPARMELLLRQEEELDASTACKIAVEQLREIVGDHLPETFEKPRRVLVNWARDVKLPEEIQPVEALLHQGLYRELLDQIEVARSQLLLAKEDKRSDLSLHFSASYQGEDPNQPFGDDRRLSDEHFGGEAALIWNRPFGYVETRSRIREQEARLKQLSENLRELELNVRVNLRSAHIGAASARERLKLVNEAVSDAERTLKAEEERFRLGENRSRDLLDAQEDLTDVVVRQTRIAAELIRFSSDFYFAAGYGLRQGFNSFDIRDEEKE